LRDNYSSQLAGEFLVAGELSRRGYSVSITIGNAKSIDMFASTRDGKTPFMVDAKATRSKTSWPIRPEQVNEHIFYVFVFLQTKDGIKANLSSEYFVVKGYEIISKDLIRPWKSMPGIPYNALKSDQYQNRWDKLPSPE
jgi:hypothetical protein